MWAVRARLSAIAATIVLFGFADRPAFARGSQLGHDDPWNSEHIQGLPPEVRNAVIHMGNSYVSCPCVQWRYM
jgi:hypothetical protein